MKKKSSFSTKETIIDLYECFWGSGSEKDTENQINIHHSDIELFFNELVFPDFT